MQISRLSHCSFPVFWYLYNVVHLLHMVHFHLEALIILQCCKLDCSYFTLPCNRKCGTLTSHFFPLLHGVSLIVSTFIYLSVLPFSDFHYNSCNFRFLVLWVCTGSLSAILCSDLSIHVPRSPKIPCGR